MIKLIQTVNLLFMLLLIAPVTGKFSNRDGTSSQRVINLLKQNKGKVFLAIFSVMGIFLYRYRYALFMKKNNNNVDTSNEKNLSAKNNFNTENVDKNDDENGDHFPSEDDDNSDCEKRDRELDGENMHL